MTHPNVQPETLPSEPSPWLDIADELEKIAEDARALAGEPAPACFSIIVQPKNPDPYPQHTAKSRPKVIAAVDAIAHALLGKPSADRRMGDGSYHRDASGRRGAIDIATYTSVADPAAVDPEQEIARLRAENEQLRAEVATERYGQKQVQPGGDPHPSWPTEQELKPWESLAPAAARSAESVKPIDPDSSMEAHYDAEADRPVACVPECGGGRQCRCQGGWS